MTTWEKIEAIESLIQEYVDDYNKLHKQAKDMKKEKIQPLQKDREQLYKQWKSELKNKNDG